MKYLAYFCDNKRHLVCHPYSIDNLHRMAKDLGIHRCWFHKNHYGIPLTKLGKVKDKCIAIVSSKDIVRIIRNVTFNIK